MKTHQKLYRHRNDFQNILHRHYKMDLQDYRMELGSSTRDGLSSEQSKMVESSKDDELLLLSL